MGQGTYNDWVGEALARLSDRSLSRVVISMKVQEQQRLWITCARAQSSAAVGCASIAISLAVLFGVQDVAAQVDGALVETPSSMPGIMNSHSVNDSAGSFATDAGRASALGEFDPHPTPQAWHCEPRVTHRIRPSVLLRGEASEVTATLTVRPDCRLGTFPVHTVLVLTGMESVRGSSSRTLLNGLLTLVEIIGTGEYQSTRIGVVIAEGDGARTVLPLTGDRDAVLRSIRRWHSSSPATAGGVSDAIVEADDALNVAAGRLDPDDDEDRLQEFVVLIGDIGGQPRCSGLARNAERLKRSDVLVLTACVGPSCVTRCHQDIATSDRFVYSESEWKTLGNILCLKFEDWFILPQRLDVETTIAPSFTYVEDSAEPPLTLRDGVRLGWSAEGIASSKTPVTYTYRVRPTLDVPGNHAVAIRTSVSMWSTWDYPDHMVQRTVLSPHLLILEPRRWPELVLAATESLDP